MEATESFFAMTKLFQSNDVSLPFVFCIYLVGQVVPQDTYFYTISFSALSEATWSEWEEEGESLEMVISFLALPRSCSSLTEVCTACEAEIPLSKSPFNSWDCGRQVDFTMLCAQH